MNLNELKAGQYARITHVNGKGHHRAHFLDMGMIPGVEVELIKFAPMGDPLEIRLHGYELTLRIDDAKQIEIEVIPSLSKNESYKLVGKKEAEHPGLGEDGKYHIKKREHPLPEDVTLTFALAGNQNCGKTTLFNQMTGSNQHVGNFPGVTVDQKSGPIQNHTNTLVTDLPGIYSLSPYSQEEIVSREYILNEKPKGIINIVDATNIERNMYLTMQLMELDVPMVLALNMMDEVKGNGGSILINDMESILGIPVVPISASRNEGVKELIHHAIHIAKYQEKPKRLDFCIEEDHDGAVHRCLHGIMHLIEDHARKYDIPIRFAATKLVEGDEQIEKNLHLSDNEKEMIEHIILQMENERGMDRCAAIADMRFTFIKGVVEKCVIKPVSSKERERSQNIDKILTGKYTAIPAFVGIMGCIFYLTFNVIGAYFQNILASLVDVLTSFISHHLITMHVNSTLHSLIVDGICNGIGSVISFLPIIVTLFFFLSLLEDTGYMARIAFVMDKLLRKIGLSGRSIVPMLIGFGCTVPGVMSSRTLPSSRDRKLTILLIPFMSCSAKLPIYGFFVQTFFPAYSGIIMIGLYLLGILIGILIAYISKSTVFKGEAVPFVMELPNYRMPGLKNVSLLLWEKAKDFLTKAFTIIFMASILIWFLQTFDIRLNVVTDSQNSILASIASLISPIFTPLGFNDWRISTALITGFIAKESVVSTLSILYGSTLLASHLHPVAGASLLVFCLLYTPCVAAITSIKRELGTRWAFGIVLFQCSIAWIVAFIVHTIGLFIF
ncbi:MAG: ferrous iron transport protein B [Holdemanella sp.]|nr:ferrous iron transport protein B [Holdemanella sp.]